MARHQLTGGGGIAFQRSGVGDWVALLSKGFTQRHHQSTHFSFFRGIRFFFSTTPVCLGLKDKNVKGVGVLRFNGAAWETGWHFCPRDSLNVIINQPTSLLFRGRCHRVTAALDGDKHQRREGLWRSAEHERAVRPRGTFTDRMMCNCVGFHDGLTREHCTWVNN